MRWDLQIVAKATGGRAVGSAEVLSVVIDSRQAGPGALFVALQGEHHDGHEFAADAVAEGAGAVLVRPGGIPGGSAGVEVSDPLQALCALGAARRAELGAPLIAVTGSSGKTTTKDFIAAALGPDAHAAPRSFNNEIGVPLTILGAPDDPAAIVVEVGSRGSGHISALGEVIRPDVAVITNIGRAHLETFGTVEAVLEAKWELVDLLGPGGTAVLPAADERLIERRRGPLLTFGEHPGSDVAVSDIRLDESGIASCEISHGGSSVRVRMPLPGRHQPGNAAAAVAAAIAIDRRFEDAVAGLAEARVSRWRMEVRRLAFGPGSIVVVNDAYNANPDSMAAALRTVVELPGRHLAVLGKMHELGDAEAPAHHEVGALAARLGFDVIAVGDDPGIAAGAGAEAVSVHDVVEAVDHLKRVLQPDDVVLVKASRAAGLEAVAAALEEVPA